MVLCLETTNDSHFTFAVVIRLIVGLNCLTDSAVLFEKNSLSEKQGKEEKDAA